MSVDLRADWIDSRDINDRIEYIETAYDFDYDEFAGPSDFEAHIAKTSQADADEYMVLYGIQQDGQSTFGAFEWDCGITLVRSDDFVNYAKQYAEEVGAVSSEWSWPHSHIDWEAAADSLKMDYTEIEIAGTLYLGRA